MIPTPGRIVEYRLDEHDAATVNRRRNLSNQVAVREIAERDGTVLPIGNGASVGAAYPMVIVRCWGQTEESSVNGQVLLDGDDSLWVTSVSQGDGQRQWHAYPRVTDPAEKG